MKTSLDQAKARKVDEALQIYDLFNGKDFAFDFVVAELNGVHPKVVNRVSDRAYFVLDGEGQVFVGDSTYMIKKNDLITIKHGTPHGLKGKLRYVIITAPPFDPNNESVIE